jgi:hypothetical protein
MEPRGVTLPPHAMERQSGMALRAVMEHLSVMVRRNVTQHPAVMERHSAMVRRAVMERRSVTVPRAARGAMVPRAACAGTARARATAVPALRDQAGPSDPTVQRATTTVRGTMTRSSRKR